MTEREIVSGFDDLRMVIDGKVHVLNVEGLMSMDGKEYVVVTDLPALDIEADTYCIFRLLRNNGKVEIEDVVDDAFYDLLCEAWEEAVEAVDMGEEGDGLDS